MRKTWWLWAAAFVAGCSGSTGGEGDPLDSDPGEVADGTSDLGTAEVPGFEVDVDTGTPDTKPDGKADTAADTMADTGGEASTGDTAGADTATTDTGPTPDATTDSGAADAATADSTIADTGAVDSTTVDTGGLDSGAVDTGGTDAPTDTPDTKPAPPTVKITLPALNTKIPYDKTSDACQSRLFTVSYTAPAGFRSMKWLWVTPSKAAATTALIGTCDGLPAYGYFMDATKYAGSTSGTFSEDVAVAGLYSGAAGSGRWWWCTEPTKTTGGGVSTAGVSLADLTYVAPPAPSPSGAVQTLSNYCYAKTTPPDTDLGARWQLQVTIVDAVGATATDTLWFWVHQ
ncbi:MAG: hypothetical protein JNL79_29195 [Myxococcales bacterium]|nr:hypothetical protein [Myxococcales bacterium]